MDNKKFSPTQIIIIIGLIGLAFYLGFRSPGKKAEEELKPSETVQNNQTQIPEVKIEDVKSAFNESQIKFGDDSKKVIFLEISDPSCPYCSIASGYNNALNSQSGERFKLVEDGGTYVAPVREMKKLVESGEAAFAMIYRNGHGNGEVAMKALYCANEQGKFWEAKALIFGAKGYDLINNTVKNDMTKTGLMADFLASVLDSKKMKTCLDGNQYKEQLVRDTNISGSLGVGGTPGFFVNEKMFSGAYSYTDMEASVNSALSN